MLQDESYEKKEQGIKFWQSSEVYKKYLELGQQSITQNKSIQEIINDKKNKSQPTLSWEEFEAIGDLNSLLNF